MADVPTEMSDCSWQQQKYARPEISIAISIEVEKQTQMMLVHQNILIIVMPKNVKLSNGNVRLQLATAEIC